MADRTVIPLYQIVRGGVVGTGAGEVTGVVADGHFIAPGPNSFLAVRNSGGAPYNVTIPTPGTVDGQAIADRVVAVANGAVKFIGPFTTDYMQADGTVYIDVENAALMLKGFYI